MTAQWDQQELGVITMKTVGHYEANAWSYWSGTKDHDVTQNYAALLAALPQRTGLKILDFGCGPGRDLAYFKSQGHLPTGLDGAASFCAMAREYSGCPVLHQNFLALDLPSASFDGIFANASLFHIPGQELPGVLTQLKNTLIKGGILFSSNPRGSGEGWTGERYASYLEWDDYVLALKNAGFVPLQHFYRPPGLPRDQQPWLAVVSRALS